jgi:E3 ubiquitin-protein ligase RNF115/126
MRRPADESIVKALPLERIRIDHCLRREDGVKMENPTCLVCTEELAIGQEALFLPCGHAFDPECIRPWLLMHNSCPVCREQLPREAEADDAIQLKD